MFFIGIFWLKNVPYLELCLILVILNKRPLLISSQSDYLIQVCDRNSHNQWQTMQIQISWLLQKPTDLDLHCLLNQGMSCSAREDSFCLSSVDAERNLFTCFGQLNLIYSLEIIRAGFLLKAAGTSDFCRDDLHSMIAWLFTQLLIEERVPLSGIERGYLGNHYYHIVMAFDQDRHCILKSLALGKRKYQKKKKKKKTKKKKSYF